MLEEDYEQLKAIVFSKEKLEGAAYLLCGRSETKDEVRLLVREVAPVLENHYLVRDIDRLSIDSASYAAISKRARTNNASIIFVHGHPNGLERFSDQDNREEPKLLHFFSTQIPNILHGSLVLTPASMADCRVWSETGWVPINRIRVIGRRFIFKDFGPEIIPLPEFFDRQVRAFGPEIQRLLQSLHIGVVGAGGTGSPVVEQLTRLGVGTISVFDGDDFEDSNVSRVYGSSTLDNGTNKAVIASAHATRINVGTKINTHTQHITDEQTAKHLRECDIVFGCTDMQAPRGILVQLALRYFIPVLDVGVKIDAPEQVIRGINGRVTTLIPGEACLFCRERITSKMIQLESLSPEERQLLADQDYAPELETDNPAVITFTTAVAAQAISDLLHRLTGFMGEERQSSEVLMFFHESTVKTNRTPASPICICTKREFWGVGDTRDFLGLMWPEPIKDSVLPIS